MRVLITGATGLIGSEIVKNCHAKGIAVNYLTTNKSKIENNSNYQGFYWNPSQFKIDVTIHNNYTQVSNVVSLNQDSILDVLDLFDISFEAENTLDLNSILSDLGITLADFDAAILDTE